MNPVPIMKLVEIIRGYNTSDEVTNIINDVNFPVFPGDKYQGADYWSVLDKKPNPDGAGEIPVPVTDAVGAIAVARVNTASGEEQILTLTTVSYNGKDYSVLDIDLPAPPTIPDAFNLKGPIFFSEDGTTYSDNAGSTAFGPPNDSVVGDLYVAQPTSSGVGVPADPSSARELKGWTSATHAGDVKGKSGSLIVCVVGGSSSTWAEMGALDYTPGVPGLDQVLGTNDTASGKNITLKAGNIAIVTESGTGGNISTELGNITTSEGNVVITKGDLSVEATGANSIRIGAKSGDAGTGPTLSVPNIDFGRFPSIADIPDVP